MLSIFALDWSHLVVVCSKELKALDVIAIPSLHLDHFNWILLILGNQLHYWVCLSWSKEWRFQPVWVSQLQGVNSDTSTCFKFSEYPLGEFFFYEELIISCACDLWEFKVRACGAAFQRLFLNCYPFGWQWLVNGEVVELLQFGVDFELFWFFLHLSVGEDWCKSFMLHLSSSLKSIGNFLNNPIGFIALLFKLLIQLIDRMERWLIQLLETLVDLSSVLRCHISCSHDQLVKVRGTAVVISCFVDTMTLLALLLAFGTVVGDMSLQVFSSE